MLIFYALFFALMMIGWAFVVTEGLRSFWRKLFGRKLPKDDDFSSF